METLKDLMLHMVQDIYYAEKALVKAMPKMSRKATAPELVQAFDEHRMQTETQIERLEQVFEMLGKKPKAIPCAAMDGLLEEAQDIMKEVEDPEVRDAGLIAGAQAIEHYEIARYGAMVAWAKQLGHTEIAQLLQVTLNEEKATDKLLSTLALKSVNQKAA